MLYILATLIAIAKSHPCFEGSYTGFPGINYDVFVDVGPTTTTVKITTNAAEAVGIGFGSQTMANTYAVIVDTSGYTEVVLKDSAVGGGYDAIAGAANWMSFSDETVSGTRTIMMTRDNSIPSCSECNTFSDTNVRLAIVYATGTATDSFTGHIFRGGARLQAMMCPTTTTSAPITPAPVTTTTAAEDTCFSGSYTDGTYSYAVDVIVGASTTTVTAQATVVASMGIGFGAMVMEGTYAVVLDSGGPTEVTLRATPSRGYDPIQNADNWMIDSDTTSGGIRTVRMTRDNSISNGFNFSPSNNRLQIVYAISANDPFSRHVFRGGARLQAIVCLVPPPPTPMPVMILPPTVPPTMATAHAEPVCFAASYSGFPAIRYDILVAVGDSFTTVTINTNADEPVGIGFGGRDMDGTYAVIVDNMGPREVGVYSNNNGADRGFADIMNAGNWVLDSETNDVSGRTIVMTRANSVSCTGCFSPFDPANTRLNIIACIAFDEAYTGHLWRVGDRLQAVPCPTTATPAPVTPAPVTPMPTAPSRRGSKTPRPTTLSPTATPTRRRKSAAAKRGGGKAIPATTASPTPRMKSPRTTKAPKVRTKSPRTPSPTPMPTEECDCYSTTLVGRQVIGGNKCYKYEVDFCKPGMNSVILGDGNADKECGITDVMDVITNVRAPDGVTHSSYYDDKVRGLKLDGLMSGDKFRVCFDKNVVDSTLKAGFIEYQTYGGDVSCKQDNNLPDLCPAVVSNAASGGSGGTGKTDPCACNSVTLVGTPYSNGDSCYRYQVQFCNDNYDTIEMGMGNPEELCDTKIKSVFKSAKPPSLQYQIGRPFRGDEAHSRGITISGLSSGDMFTLCFDSSVVYDVRQYGSIDFLNPRGREETCPVTDTLFDLCPGNDPPFSAHTPRHNRYQTTAPPTDRRRRTKTPRPTTAEPTPEPTPMPTDQCDCVSTELISRNVIGNNKCYRYEVNFCNDEINAFTLGDGNADAECGVDFMAVITEIDIPGYASYATVYNDKVRGLKIIGLNSGDRFRVCYDKDVVDNTEAGGFIGYFTDAGDFSCMQDDNLPNLCPRNINNAENGSGGTGKTDPCACNSVTLLNPRYAVGLSCYRYEVQFCNDNYDTIEMGMAKPGDMCDTTIESVFDHAKPPSLQYEVGRPFEGDEHHARGIKIMGLSSGDKFTLCFKGTDFDVRQYGTIDFLNPRGREETCPVTDTLFDLCPTVDPPFPAKAEGGSVALQIAAKDEDKHRPFESPTMIYMWSALCSALVSMAAVFIVYVSCIAPKGGIDNIRGYGKVLDSDEDEDEEEDSTEEEDESTESEEDEV